MDVVAFGGSAIGKASEDESQKKRTKVKEGSSYQCTYCPFKKKWVASFPKHNKIHTNGLNKYDQCELKF